MRCALPLPVTRCADSSSAQVCVDARAPHVWSCVCVRVVLRQRRVAQAPDPKAYKYDNGGPGAGDPSQRRLVMPLSAYTQAMRNGSLPAATYAFYTIHDKPMADDFRSIRALFGDVLAVAHPELGKCKARPAQPSPAPQPNPRRVLCCGGINRPPRRGAGGPRTCAVRVPPCGLATHPPGWLWAVAAATRRPCPSMRRRSRPLRAPVLHPVYLAPPLPGLASVSTAAPS